MAGSRFIRALRDRDEITISVIGRRSGRKITLPVWFVLGRTNLWLLPVRGSRNHWFRNLRANPALVVRAGRVRRAFRARPTRDRRLVRAVVRRFREKYTPAEIRRFYSRFDAAVRVPLETGRT